MFIPPAEVATLMGFLGLIVCFMSIYFMNKFNRRTLFNFGVLANFVLFIIAGLGIRIKDGNIVVICIFMFIMTFCSTNGSVFWLYIAEITTDKALGIAIFIRMMTLFILSLISLPLT